MNTEMTIERAMEHADLSGIDRIALEERARHTLPHYIWYWKNGAEKRGYCTACRQAGRIPQFDAYPDYIKADPYIDDEDRDSDAAHPERAHGMEAPPFFTHWNGAEAFDQSGKHGHFGNCLICGEVVQFRAMGRGRKNLKNRSFLIQYRPSAAEDGAVVMLGWLVQQDWGQWDDYNEPDAEMDISLREICVFRPGHGGERFVSKPLWMADSRYTQNGIEAINFRIANFIFERRKKCVGGFDPWAGVFGSGTRFYMDCRSIEDTVCGTPWEIPYNTLKAYSLEYYDTCLDMIDIFDFIARYPSVEYICKLGLGQLAGAAMETGKKRLINLRGRTAQKVLRINGNDWGWIKGHPGQVSAEYMELLWKIRALGLGVSCDLLRKAMNRCGKNSVEWLIRAVVPERAAQALKWCICRGISMHDYADYLEQLTMLEIRTQDKSVLYPADFLNQHERLSKRVKKQKSEAQNAMIQARMKNLGEYFFSALGLTLRPMASSAEIIREGEMMRHCVATYADRYAKGETVLLCLREDDHLDRPYRTVEFSTNGRLVQCRGERNRQPEDEQERIDRFWALYEAFRTEWKKQHKKKNTKERKTA